MEKQASKRSDKNWGSVTLSSRLGPGVRQGGYRVVGSPVIRKVPRKHSPERDLPKSA